MKNKLKRIFASVRYSLMFKTMKYITPIMYEKFIILNNIWKSKNHIGGKLDNVNRIPRPAILFIKKYFKDKLITGLELGVKLGKNSESILKELNIQTLYLIDAWDDYVANEITKEGQKRHYLLTLKKFKDDNRVKIIKGFSENIVHRFDNESLDFVYIDGNHSYDFVYQDITIWSKKVKQNGIISGHDIFNFNDVLSAVKKWSIKNQYNFFIKPPDWYIIKKDIITCKECSYCNKELDICTYESIEKLSNKNLEICICFMPIMNYNIRK